MKIFITDEMREVLQEWGQNGSPFPKQTLSDVRNVGPNKPMGYSWQEAIAKGGSTIEMAWHQNLLASHTCSVYRYV